VPLASVQEYIRRLQAGETIDRPTQRPAGAVGAAGAAGPVAVASLAGVCDLVQAARDGTGRGAVPDLLGGGPDEVPDRYRIASPFELVPLGLPTVLVHGEADECVPVAPSRWCAQVAEVAGDPVELVELPGVDDREVLDPASDAWREVDRRLRRWAPC
jgi:pimeloyl-ACP methyl ester carboxylesterase